MAANDNNAKVIIFYYNFNCPISPPKHPHRQIMKYLTGSMVEQKSLSR